MKNFFTYNAYFSYNATIADLLEYIVEDKIQVDLVSDQTSCYDANHGGYTPVGYLYQEARKILHDYLEDFKDTVNGLLVR